MKIFFKGGPEDGEYFEHLKDSVVFVDVLARPKWKFTNKNGRYYRTDETRNGARVFKFKGWLK